MHPFAVHKYGFAQDRSLDPNHFMRGYAGPRGTQAKWATHVNVIGFNWVTGPQGSRLG